MTSEMSRPRVYQNRPGRFGCRSCTPALAPCFAVQLASPPLGQTFDCHALCLLLFILLVGYFKFFLTSSALFSGLRASCVFVIQLSGVLFLSGKPSAPRQHFLSSISLPFFSPSPSILVSLNHHG
jgi:hypothetical protein